jgi:hypothetical protein
MGVSWPFSSRISSRISSRTRFLKTYHYGSHRSLSLFFFVPYRLRLSRWLIDIGCLFVPYRLWSIC